MPPPVEADTNEVERVYICIFNQSLSLSLSLFLSLSFSFFLSLSLFLSLSFSFFLSLSLSLSLSLVKSQVTFSTTITMKEYLQNISVSFVPRTFVILCSAAAIDALTR